MNPDSPAGHAARIAGLERGQSELFRRAREVDEMKGDVRAIASDVQEGKEAHATLERKVDDLQTKLDEVEKAIIRLPSRFATNIGRLLAGAAAISAAIAAVIRSIVG